MIGMKNKWLLCMLPHDTFLMPYGIMYISSALKNYGADVTTQNLTYLKEDIISFFKKMILVKKINVIGLSGYSWQCSELRKIIHIIKEISEDVTIVCGGGIITTQPIIAMEALEFADIGIIGEGEECICELDEVLEGKKKISDVPGIVYKDDNRKWILTAERKFIKNIDNRPLPDREGFGYSWFVQRSHPEPYIGIFNSRSCVFKCTFCYHYEPYRQRSLDSVFEELDFIMEKYNYPSFIHFYDELFSINKEHIKEFCKRIKEYKIEYEIYMRVTDITSDVVKLLQESGCRKIGLGLESYSNEILESMNKKITQQDIDRALKIIENEKIGFMGNFILGDINDTYETVKESLKFRDMHPEYNINIYMIRTLPGSYIYENAVQRGIIKDQVEFLRNDCPYVNISKMSDEEWTSLWDKCIEETIYCDKYLTDYDLVPISINGMNGYGNGIYKLNCPVCKKETLLNTTLMRYASKISCNNCNKQWDIDPLRFFKTENFNFSKEKKYTIWGCNSVAYHIIKRYEINDVHFDMVDINTNLIGRTIFSHKIKECNEVKNSNVVIIAAVGSRQKIIKNIRENYTNIKEVYCASIMKKRGEYKFYLRKVTDYEINMA